jgi:hypothetical protein
MDSKSGAAAQENLNFLLLKNYFKGAFLKYFDSVRILRKSC